MNKVNMSKTQTIISIILNQMNEKNLELLEINEYSESKGFSLYFKKDDHLDTTPKKWGIGVSFYDEVEVSETKIVPQMIFKIKPFSGSTVKISITKECPGEFDEKFIAEQFDSVLAAVKMINFPLIEHLDFAGCIIEIDYEIIGEDNPIKVSASVESKMVEDIVASESLPEDIFLGVSNDKSYRLISASIIDIQSNLNNEAQGKLMISVSNDNISRTLKYLKANLGQPE